MTSALFCSIAPLVFLAVAPLASIAASTTCAATSADQRLTYEVYGTNGAPRDIAPKVDFITGPVGLKNFGSPYNFLAHTTVWKTTDAFNERVVDQDLTVRPPHLEAISKSAGGLSTISMDGGVEGDVLYRSFSKAISSYSPKDAFFQSYAGPSFAQKFVIGPFTTVKFTLRFELAVELDRLQSGAAVPGLRPSAVATAMLAAADVPADGAVKAIQPQYSQRQIHLVRQDLTGASDRDRRVVVGTLTRIVINENAMPATGYVNAWMSLEASMNTEDHPLLSPVELYDDPENPPSAVRPPTGKALVLCPSI